jgi:anti-sigma B factor antagonist
VSLAKSLIDEARQVIRAEMQQQHRRYMMRERWTSSCLSLLTAELLTAFEEAQIYEILAKHLPGMGIYTAALAAARPAAARRTIAIVIWRRIECQWPCPYGKIATLLCLRLSIPTQWRSCMNIETRELKHVSVVTITGRVDSATAPHVEKALQHLIEAGRHQVVLDLHDTEYMSSAGLRALVSGLKAAKKSGGDLMLAQLSAGVKEALDLAGLDVFNVFGDVVEAVGAF